MRMNKKAQLGSSVITMYRILVVILISVVILGISSLAYAYNVNVRDSEAQIMSREIFDCLVSRGVVDLLALKDVENIFVYCGFDVLETERFYVSANIFIEKEERLKIEGGDRGLLWVRDLFLKENVNSDNDRYRVGSAKLGAVLLVKDGASLKEGTMIVEVALNAE
jgi:hypothetical protein